ILQADVELADLERRQIELSRMNRTAQARINTLLREHPNRPLPPPPKTLPGEADLEDVHFFHDMALTQRADLAAIVNRLRADEAALALASKQFYADVDLCGRYDTFWQPASTQGDLRGSVGLNVNVPVYRNKLHAAVCEAQFNLNKRQAEYEQRMIDIQYEV